MENVNIPVTQNLSDCSLVLNYILSVFHDAAIVFLDLELQFPHYLRYSSFYVI